MIREEIFQLAVGFRRHFHRYPEVSEEEYGTQAYIAGILDRYGIVYTKVGTGIIAVVGKGEPCVALRGEMDALRVKEETGLPFCSESEGIMHACGHDLHLAMVLAVLLALKEQELELKGTVKVVFQPSEEKRPGGARLLLPELLKEPLPRAIFAQHVYPALPVGTVGFRSGAFFASSDNIRVTIAGRGTHAATPQNGSDPILAAACLIQFYQTLVTKFRDPLIPAVVSVTSVHGGTAHNVIPDRVELKGTVRTHDNVLREQIFKLIDEKSEAICGLYGCRFVRDKTANGLPVLMNDEMWSGRLWEKTSGLPGINCVYPMSPLTLGEDFAIYLQHIPGVMWVLGVRPPAEDSMPPLHSPKFAPDENALEVGIRMLMQSVRMVLEQ